MWYQGGCTSAWAILQSFVAIQWLLHSNAGKTPSVDTASVNVAYLVWGGGLIVGQELLSLVQAESPLGDLLVEICGQRFFRIDHPKGFWSSLGPCFLKLFVFNLGVGKVGCFLDLHLSSSVSLLKGGQLHR